MLGNILRSDDHPVARLRVIGWGSGGRAQEAQDFRHLNTSD